MMRPNEPKFEAGGYFTGRPFYPSLVYEHLFKRLTLEKKRPEVLLDLACGAGQSLSSFWNASVERGLEPRSGFAVDVDPAMLARAEAAYTEQYPAVNFLLGSAEEIPIPRSSVDLILIGSAFHWFHADRALPELARVLKPGGYLFIYEYQFPKCLSSAELHESVKRRFNLEWKAPRQMPRGTLSQMMEPFRNSSDWTLISEARPIWQESLTLEGFLGHLFSQSRYLHAEAEQSDPSDYRAEITEFFRPYFDLGELQFDLKPGSVLLRKASLIGENDPKMER